MIDSFIIDISPPLDPTTAVWPGDTPLSYQRNLALENGDSVTLSTLTCTVHIGAHADAPSHYHPSGVSIEQVDLSNYIGPCLVVACPGTGAITTDECQTQISKFPRRNFDRVLFRTTKTSNYDIFPDQFRYFNPDTVHYLGSQGCRLVGLDTPSVDHFESKDLPAHRALYRYNMANLENLQLNEVESGCYELIALPLRLVGLDASPVRAIL